MHADSPHGAQYALTVSQDALELIESLIDDKQRSLQARAHSMPPLPYLSANYALAELRAAAANAQRI